MQKKMWRHFVAAGGKIECTVEHTGYTWTGEGDGL